MNYSFIGFGNMASAIFKGMQNSESFTNDKIYAFDKDAEKLSLAAKKFGLLPCENEIEASLSADVIILAVKPQNLSELLPKIRNAAIGKLIITIAAGKDIAFYENNLEKGAALVRVMPNINAKAGGAISAICANASANKEQIEKVIRIFSTVGSVMQIEEKFFPVFGAIAGSSVAFVYMYIDALIKSLTANGISEEDARKIAACSVSGSAQLVLSCDEEPLNLTKQVCSPGGTTIEGVTLLNDYGFEEKLIEAVDAILKKDEILRKG